MARRIERCSATHAWLVCERDGEVAGYAYGAPLKDRAAYRWTVEVSVYVGEGFARQGVGRELYQALFELMRRQGLRRIVAGITLPNDASVALHEGLGFELIGAFKRVGWKQGAWRDVSWWQLDLPGGDAPPTEPGLPQRLSASP
jgi:phosphinothricin acetyltransferase